MKMNHWSKKYLMFFLGALTTGGLSFIAASNAQNPFVKLVMRLGEERVLEDGTKVAISKGEGDLIIVTLARPASNRQAGVNLGEVNPTPSPTARQSYQRSDLLGSWECFEITDEYQEGSGKIPSSSTLAFLAKFSSSGVYHSASPEDRLFRYPTSILNWKYTVSSNKSGVYELLYQGMIAARCRIRWIDADTFEDEILFSNEPSYIGIKRVFRRIR